MEFSFPIILFVISASVTPGPNNVMIMSSGVNHGVKKSIPHLLGIGVGFTIMVIAVGVGFGFVFNEFPIVHQIIKLIGIVYLLYLSWLIANTSTASLENNKAKPFSFWQAALFQWVNPKAWVMITGAVAAFTSVSPDLFSDVFFIALMFLIFGTPCVCVWLFFGVALKKYMSSEKHLRIFNISMALLLVVSILPSIYELLWDSLAFKT